LSFVGNQGDIFERWVKPSSKISWKENLLGESRERVTIRKRKGWDFERTDEESPCRLQGVSFKPVGQIALTIHEKKWPGHYDD